MTDHLLENIDRLIQQRPVYKKILESYRELVNLMKDVETKSQDTKIEGRLEDIKKKEGFPVFSREDLPIDLETSSEVLAKFLDCLSNSQREDKNGLKKALQKSKTEPEWPIKLFKAILRQDEKTQSKTGKEVDLDPKVLLFLAKVALKPSLSALHDSVSPRIDKKKWDYGYCPLCGSQPDIAYFDKPGKRYLHCELCKEEWPYPRLKCPFCQNEDHETLGYFQADKEEGFRVDFCKKCQRYLKTVDKRVFEDAAPMELENLATIHLDILANEHGFK